MFDLFVIGGGINGCGIARDAVGRGYSVMLAEMDDLASGTSSAATKLVHGGLRYLEHYEFRLVRESLGEREVLWAMAPHIIWPLRFVLPHHKGLRPAFVLRRGWRSTTISAGASSCRRPGRSTCGGTSPASRCSSSYKLGFEYSDCWVDDARLVALKARDAAERGADILTRTKVDSGAARMTATGTIDLREPRREQRTVQARMLVNAAGPWVDMVLQRSMAQRGRTMCGWSRAAISWCASSTSTTAAISSRTATGGSSSPFPMRTTSP